MNWRREPPTPDEIDACRRWWKRTPAWIEVFHDAELEMQIAVGDEAEWLPCMPVAMEEAVRVAIAECIDAALHANDGAVDGQRVVAVLSAIRALDPAAIVKGMK